MFDLLLFSLKIPGTEGRGGSSVSLSQFSNVKLNLIRLGILILLSSHTGQCSRQLSIGQLDHLVAPLSREWICLSCPIYFFLPPCPITYCTFKKLTNTKKKGINVSSNYTHCLGQIMQIKLDCSIPFKTYINQSLGQCSGIEGKFQIICISVQQLEALFFFASNGPKN